LIAAIIPARGGSRRLPRKNVAMFRGLPMITYPIVTATHSELFKTVIVSTDDDEIEQVALRAGATVVRRPLDDGTKGTQEVAADVLKQLPEVTIACVIYATSPLLDVHTLYRGFYALQGHKFVKSVDSLGQDAGCFYWGEADAFRQGLPLEAKHTATVQLPVGRVCDINTVADMERAGQLYDSLRGKHASNND
jgi:pseudaminic acid cytidylyltransferase